MKIAIIGSDSEQRKEVVTKIMNKWTCFVQPAETVAEEISDSVVEDADIFKRKKHKGILSTLNGYEKRIWNKIILIENQLKKYKLKKNILFCGCTMDVLMETLQAYSDGKVSDQFVEKVIKHNKSVIKEIDLVYMVRNKDIEKKYETDVLVKEVHQLEEPYEEDGEKVTEEVKYVLPESLTDEQKGILKKYQLEQYYQNYLDRYFKDGDNSNLFPPEGAAMEQFMSSDPISEFGDIVDEHGNLAMTSRNPEEVQKLLNLFKGESHKKIVDILTGDNKISFDQAFPQNQRNFIEL